MTVSNHDARVFPLGELIEDTQQVYAAEDITPWVELTVSDL